MGKFTEWAKANNLTQEAAQAAMDMAADMQLGTARQMQAALDAQGETWASEVKADKEIGGDKLAENLAVAKTALEKFATPEFKAFLDSTKLGNHPEMLRAWLRVGQAISQDGFVPGRQGASADARGMYVNSNMNP